jgi:hypothetical protein
VPPLANSENGGWTGTVGLFTGGGDSSCIRDRCPGPYLFIYSTYVESPGNSVRPAKELSLGNSAALFIVSYTITPGKGDFANSISVTAFDGLTPRGYFEMQDVYFKLHSNDGIVDTTAQRYKEGL